MKRTKILQNFRCQLIYSLNSYLASRQTSASDDPQLLIRLAITLSPYEPLPAYLLAKIILAYSVDPSIASQSTGISFLTYTALQVN